MLVHDRWALGRGIAVAPVGQSDDHRLEIETLLRQVVCGKSLRPLRSGHQPFLDEQSEQIFATTDDIAERVRKIGGTTLRSIGHIGRLQRVLDNDADFVTPLDMLAELRDDNKQLVASLRETHSVCDEHNDVASASLIENWIDEAERRTWFLFEATRVARE